MAFIDRTILGQEWHLDATLATYVPLLPQAAGPVWGKSGTLPLLCQCFVGLAYSDSLLFNLLIFIGFSLATMVRNDVDPVRRLQTSHVH